MYESRRSPLLPRRAYAWRVVRHVGVAMLVAGGSLLAGVVGYRCFERKTWGDAFLHAAMVLAGIGVVDMPQTPAGRVFVGGYALYAGAVFLVVAGIVFAPIVHRLLHRFHWDEGKG